MTGAELRPLRGVRYNPSAVDMDSVLAPPYDVIDGALRARLYARGPHNVVRIDAGEELPTDRPGTSDRYTRARELLGRWIEGGILVADSSPSFYATDHRFRLRDGSEGHRRGVFGTIAADDWDRAPIRPHERTLRGPKADRLALMRATNMHTSAVFGVWTGAQGLSTALEAATAGRPTVEACLPGELGDEHVRLWVVDETSVVEDVQRASAGAVLYIADGHHRYETAAAYARERRERRPSAPGGARSDHTLAYLSPASDPMLQLLPTHRMIRPRPGVPATCAAVSASLTGRFHCRPAAGVGAAVAAAAELRSGHHAYTVIASDGVLVVSTERAPGGGRERLDVSVLDRELLGPWGIGEEELAGGALFYDHESSVVDAAVSRGEAVLGILLNGPRIAEMLAIADAGEVMPQKSTYFYPKVPTGLVMSPL